MRQSPNKFFTAFKVLIGLSLLIFCISLLTPYPAQLVEALRGTSDSDNNTAPTPPQPSTDTPKPKPVRPVINVPMTQSWQPEITINTPEVVYPPFPPVLPTRPSTSAMYNVYDLARGLNLKTAVNFSKGSSASQDREKKSNFQMTLSLDVKQPNATKSAKDLEKLNKHLPKIFPQLDQLVSLSKISPYYGQLYSLKQNELRKNLGSLNKLLTRHNFYDLETILELEYPTTNRKALWIQSEMDVVSDGSDGDRLTKMPAKILNSSYYQPSTSYRWRKQTDKVNPLLAPWQKRLAAAQKELRTAKASEKQAILKRIDHAQRVITELKTYSFLISEYDPFIVIPLGVVKQNSDYSPQFGDYAVVIANNKIYPALVGDAGPRYKIGEGSIRLAKEINPKADSYSRPESDLKISYIVFPGSAEKEAGPPNYEQLKEKCETLLQEIGGISPEYTVHDWVDLLAPPKPKPPVTPTSEPESPSDKSTTEPDRTEASETTSQ